MSTAVAFCFAVVMAACISNRRNRFWCPRAQVQGHGLCFRHTTYCTHRVPTTAPLAEQGEAGLGPLPCQCGADASPSEEV
jgi:hypothetical protein